MDSIGGIINGSNGLFDPENFFENEGDKFFDKALRPNQVSLLHDFIVECAYAEAQYILKK